MTMNEDDLHLDGKEVNKRGGIIIKEVFDRESFSKGA